MWTSCFLRSPLLASPAARGLSRTLDVGTPQRRRTRRFSTSARRRVTSPATDYEASVQSAVQLVGPASSHTSINKLLTEEWSHVASHIKNLVAERPPLLRALEDYAASGQPSGSIRGLLVLLVSKALGRPWPPTAGESNRGTQATSSDILPSQRKLAEAAELCHVIYVMHQMVVNNDGWEKTASHNDGSKDDLVPEQSQDTLNKVAILCGDYLVAKVLMKVALLKNSKVYELIVTATKDMSASTFIELDAHIEGIDDALRFWRAKNSLAIGSVIGNSCQGALLLAGNTDEANHALVHSFGKHAALAWQAKQELDVFLVNSTRGGNDGPIKLHYTSLPVLLHLQQTGDLGQRFQLDAAQQEELVRGVISSGYGIRGSLDLIQEHSMEAERLLRELPPCDARASLLSIVHNISSRVMASSPSITF